MPLRDHFHSPVNDRHSWDEVHGLWPGIIVREMFDLLPEGYQASPKIHLGSPTEVDIGTFDRGFSGSYIPEDDRAGGVATLSAPAPTFTVEADLSEQDQYEVLIRDAERGRELVAAIEIVSPSNKHNTESRELFTGKVRTMLQQGVCVSIVDLVSNRQANLYAELLASLGRGDPQLAPKPPRLYAVTIRARGGRSPFLIDAWFNPMTVGQSLPTLPIWLSPELRILYSFESSYEETCRLLRIK